MFFIPSLGILYFINIIPMTLKRLWAFSLSLSRDCLDLSRAPPLPYSPAICHPLTLS